MKSLPGQFLVWILLAVVLLVYFFRGVEWSALDQALGAAHLLPMLGVVLAMGAAYAVRAWRWAELLAPLGRARYLDLLSATMVGFATSLVIPRAGELLRPWLISRRYPIPASAGFATIVVERLVDLFAILAILAIYLFALPRPARQVDGDFMDLLTLGGAVLAAAALAAAVLLLMLHARAERVVGAVETLLRRAPGWIATPLARILRRFSEGLAVLRAPLPQIARIGFQSLLLWLLTALAFHLNHVAFDIDLPFHATFLLVAFLVVGEAIPTPGMIGSFHAFYLLALHEAYAIDWTTAAAAGIAAHALTNLPVLVAGLALLGREGLSAGSIAGVVRQRYDA